MYSGIVCSLLMCGSSDAFYDRGSTFGAKIFMTDGTDQLRNYPTSCFVDNNSSSAGLQT